MNLWWWLPIVQGEFEIAKPAMLLKKFLAKSWLYKKLYSKFLLMVILKYKALLS